MNRKAEATAFLEGVGFPSPELRYLAADASFRSYARFLAQGRSYVLMDAPPATNGSGKAFLETTAMLRAANLSAPKIYDQNLAEGFIVLEDLGDDLFATLCKSDPSLEAPLYEAAVKTLVTMQTEAIAELPPYDMQTYHKESDLVLDWYISVLQSLTDDAREGFRSALQFALDRLSTATTVFVHRDYHAENLIWLPDRIRPARVGLLDYQDARAGHPAYDLVSLIEDARRDVSEPIRQKCIALFCDLTGLDAAQLTADLSILGAQRNLKIMGIFSRLWRRDGKDKYLPLIPHVYALLQHDLIHPAVKELATWCSIYLPLPDDAIIAKIRNTSE